MPDLGGEFPNVESALVGYLGGATGLPVYTETPTTLQDVVPLVLVSVIPGGGGTDYDESVMVDIDVFAANRPGMWDAARKVAKAMRALTARTARAAYIDSVVETAALGYVTYGNVAVRRAVGTYELTVRAQ